ncbi:THUMP-like domain-containing protein [Rufibacter immobilis]|uniref:THUMP-like domain-containing protein n=1 Tax=Rufibacter immobilis TaxID=1348778 RepID=UPI0035E64181
MRVFSLEEQEFIFQHLQQDPAQLMLQAKRFPHLPMQELVSQIKARQKALQKLPTWAQNPAVVFPVMLSLEQSSSEVTAAYKAQLVQGETLADLTGGLGVDSFHFSRQFAQVTHVEQNTELQQIAQYNFQLLGASNIKSVNIAAEDFLQQLEAPLDVIYLDPARRGHSQERVHLLQDCEPDVLRLLPVLRQKARYVLLKTAPMLDLDLALQELKEVVRVWIVAVQNEVKEVLYLIPAEAPQEAPLITAVNLRPGQEPLEVSFTQPDEENAQATYAEPQRYLYEPNTALLKAGAFKWLSLEYKLHKLHRNSHLYTSIELCEAFPGRIFEIIAQPKANAKELHKLLPQKKANITVRNYPLTVAQLREKVKLKEGGSDYLFATTDLHNKPLLLLCRKVN